MCCSAAFGSQTQSSRHKRNVVQTTFSDDLGCIRLMRIINAWPLSDLKPSWWELVCYLSSSRMISVNVISEIRSQMRRDLLRKESEFSFFPMLMQNILLLCPSLLFGLLLILCSKDVFILPSLGMAWEMSFLAILVPWENVQIWHTAVLSSWSCSWPETPVAENSAHA